MALERIAAAGDLGLRVSAVRGWMSPSAVDRLTAKGFVQRATDPAVVKASPLGVALLRQRAMLREASCD